MVGLGRIPFMHNQHAHHGVCHAQKIVIDISSFSAPVAWVISYIFSPSFVSIPIIITLEYPPHFIHSLHLFSARVSPACVIEIVTGD